MASRIDDLRKRLEKDPGSRLFAQLAEELRKSGDLDEAIEVCRAGLQKHAAYTSAHMTLGRALFDKGVLSDARTELESVLKGAADNILASRMLGECLEGLGDVPAAIAQYKKTLMLAPGEPRVVERLANLEAGGEPSKPIVVAPAPPEPAEAPGPAPEPTPPAAAAAEASAPPSRPQAEAPAPVPPPPVTPAPKAAAAVAVTRPGMTGKIQAQNVVAAALAAKRTKEGAETPPGAGTDVKKKAGDIPTIARKPAAARSAAAPEAPPAASARQRFPGMTDTESSLAGIQVGDLSEPHDAQGGAAPAPHPAPPDAAAAAAEPRQAAPVSEPGGEIVSATLAELHASQGHLDEAKAMYRKLIEREPDSHQARTRLAELEAGPAAESTPADRHSILRRQIAALERMLEGVRRA